MPKSLDVVAIGNAIVDVIARIDEAFLTTHGVERGAMTLIDAERAQSLYAAMPPGVEVSGGSAGNTAAGLAALGGRAGYVGKVRDDVLGQVFSHDITAQGVRFDTAPAMDGPPTARCLVLVTPDAQRSMNTYLGACVNLTPEDVDPAAISEAQVVYLEGYLWDPPQAKEAFLKAAKIAHESGGKVALSLSDPFCVGRHRAEFLELVRHHVDILFANEQEIVSLFEAKDFDEALQKVRFEVETAALTRSERGSVVVHRDEVHILDAEKATRVVDTTGAGDLYAAGFLYGYTQGKDAATCGRLGGLCAAEIISHIGARPEVDLKKLVATQLG
ncbi:Sugar kinase [alpha proteobacterium BAL199]|jgi:sugar/nucleoside kinase (ribokinase family)|nr:Sugar kinase [alpha proteobacterium BAL199]